MAETLEKREQAVLVGHGGEYAVESDTFHTNPLDELSLLAETAGAKVVGTITQSRVKIDSRYYIGEGKAGELLEAVRKCEATTVIFDNDLSPAQVKNLEKLLDIKVIDRSGLILDIFALHARTREAKTQVELAQLKHMLPRLTRQWTHLSRQVGGIGVRGPGETQLEVDRRRVRDRIGNLSSKLKDIEKRGMITRQSRRSIFTVTLVGYTNAGKSTLFNTLAKADVEVEDKLFKTLDSRTRELSLDHGPAVLLSDTVGFIRNLPHELIASFRSTLAEVRDADLLLHVIDVTNPSWLDQLDIVDMVLGEIGAADISTLLVFNKIDSLENTGVISALKTRYPDAVFVSAAHEIGIDDLKAAMYALSLKGKVVISRSFGPSEGELLSKVYRYGTVIETHADGDSVYMKAVLPLAAARQLGFSEMPE